MPPTTAFLGLGTNLGNRGLNMNLAMAALRALPSVRVLGTSHLYDTAPAYVLNQPSFLNAAVQIETTLGPTQVHSHI
jgi:2-amino-4-hydroxy-6-hydroxymethyldihydropteridine diphosphokinase